MLCSLPHDRYKSSEAATIAHYGSTIGLNPLWIKFWPRFYIIIIITFNSILLFLILIWILLSIFYLEFSVPFLFGVFPLFFPQSRSNHEFILKFLTAILHCGLRNDYFISFLQFTLWTFILFFYLTFAPLFHLDFTLGRQINE